MCASCHHSPYKNWAVKKFGGSGQEIKSGPYGNGIVVIDVTRPAKTARETGGIPHVAPIAQNNSAMLMENMIRAARIC